MNSTASLRRFVILTFAISWGLWIPAALSSQGAQEFPTVLPFVFGGFGPTFAAIWLVARTWDKDARRDFWHRVIDVRRIRWTWWLLIIGLIPAIFVLTAAVNRVLGGEAPGMEALNQILDQPAALISTLIIGILLGPLSEELGWRGYALDELMDRWGWIRANAALAFIWWIWHLPLFFIEGTSQQAQGIGTLAFWLFAVNIIPLTLLMTRAYYANRRSILSAILLHFMFNFVFAMVYPVSVQFDVIRVIVTYVAVGLVLWLTPRGQEGTPT